MQTQLVAHARKQLLGVCAGDLTQALCFAFGVVVRRLAHATATTTDGSVFFGTFVLARRTDVAAIALAKKLTRSEIQHAVSSAAASARALDFAALTAKTAVNAFAAAGRGAAAHATVLAAARLPALQLVVGAQRIGRRKNGVVALAATGCLARAGTVARGGVVAVPTAAAAGAEVIRRLAR